MSPATSLLCLLPVLVSAPLFASHHALGLHMGFCVAGGWRSDSHLQDGFGPGGISKDLSGGLYDAGDHLKLHLPLTMTLATLALGAIEFESSYRSTGQWDTAAATLSRAAQYLIKCHIVASNTPSSNQFVAQVGDVDTDHNMWWGRPEQQPQGGASGSAGYRPVYVISSSSPGADITGQAAAAMAAISLVLAKPGAWQNPGLAADLQSRARQLLAFAQAVPGTWKEPGSSVYKSSASYSANQYAVNWDWDQSQAAAAAVLFSMRSRLSSCSNCATAAQQAQKWIQSALSQWQDTSRKCPQNDFTLCYTPGGLAFLTKALKTLCGVLVCRWGALRYTGNMALLASLYARALSSDVITSAADLASMRRSHRCWARSQLSYMAGSNPRKQSYIVGYQPAGVSASPQRCEAGRSLFRWPHHKSASCSPDYSIACSWDQLKAAGSNPSTLQGALVGGPSNDDSYSDVRTDYIHNEVAIDYNAAYTLHVYCHILHVYCLHDDVAAGFTGALAGLQDVSVRLGKAGCSWSQYCSGEYF
ncbi:hypothetical protein QJQ45_017093 [Haematococcus lacustris]|nr:hypothetical protein QJQ45_017093 [Haematococcus lacustris]